MKLKKETETVKAPDRMVDMEERHYMKEHIPYTLVPFQVLGDWKGGLEEKGESQRKPGAQGKEIAADLKQLMQVKMKRGRSRTTIKLF